MPKWKINKGTLIDIANAIREKTGESGLIQVADFADEIMLIDGNTPGSSITPSSDTTKWIIDEDTLIGIANAIRTKRGTSGDIEVADLASEILQIGPLVSKPLSGIKVTKVVSRYQVNQQPSISDLVVTAVYNDGTEEVVNDAKIDTLLLDTSTAGNTLIGVSYKGFSGTIPILVYDPNATEVNQVIMQDTPKRYTKGVWWWIKDNILYIEGRYVGAGTGYFKLSNTPDYNMGGAATAWRQETIPVYSGTEYSYAMLVLDGGKQTATVGSVRNSSTSSILSASRTPQTPSSNGAYMMLYCDARNTTLGGVIFNKTKLALMITEGNIAATSYSYKPTGQDNGIEMDFGNVTPLTPLPSTSVFVKTLTTGYNYIRSAVQVGDYYYICASNGTSSTDVHKILKLDTTTTNWTTVAESTFDVGRGYSITYCEYDGYLHVIPMDSNGTVHRVDLNLNYIDYYTIDLTSQYQDYYDVACVTYCPEKEKFVYLCRGSGNTKRYAIYSKTRTFEAFFAIPTETTYISYDDILADEKYIYQSIRVSSTSGVLQQVVRYDWNFNRIDSIELESTSGAEVSGLTWSPNNILRIQKLVSTIQDYFDIDRNNDRNLLMDIDHCTETHSSSVTVVMGNDNLNVTYTYYNSYVALDFVWDATNRPMVNKKVIKLSCEDAELNNFPVDGVPGPSTLSFYDSNGTLLRTRSLMGSQVPLPTVIYNILHGGIILETDTNLTNAFNGASRIKLSLGISGTTSPLSQNCTLKMKGLKIELLN